jgi:hypothetical protein
MHAVFLTFEFVGESSDLPGTFSRFSDTSPDEPGVVSCTWLNDGSTIGAFMVFRDATVAERYLNSARLRALAAHPAVYDFYIRHFATLGSISAAMPAGPVGLKLADEAHGNACAVWQAGIDRPEALPGDWDRQHSASS